jgi:hypothetical protein
MRPGWRLLASAALLLAGCAADPPAPPTQAPAPERAVVLALQRDARLVELALGAAGVNARAGVGPEQAVGRARQSLSTQPAGGEARLVLLSVRDYESGAAVLEPRPVWLVTFRDAVFETDACACEGHPTRPSTAVAVDPGDGSVVAAFGLAG